MKQPSKTWQAVLPSIFVLTACSQEVPEATMEPAAAAVITRSPSAESARVYFITPADGETVSSPIRIEFGLSDMELAPAGDDRPNSGHHHIIVDRELPDLGLPVPADAQRVHFGDGRSETELTLVPGQHTLQLLFADHLHRPHEPPLYSERISITVE